MYTRILYLSATLSLLAFSIISLPVYSQLLSPSALDTVKIYRSIEEALKEPDKVYKLVLKRNRLTEFPQEILQFKNLNVLDLSKNKLKEFPKELEQLPYLQELNLNSNKIDTVHSSLGQLTNLRILKMGNNEIYTIPPEIGLLVKLEILDLWSNNISRLPDEISALTKLKKLDLNGIMMDRQEQAIIRDLLPDTKIEMSQGCDCD